MSNWLKILLSALSGFITGAGVVASSGGPNKTALVAGAIGMINAVANLHAPAPKP